MDWNKLKKAIGIQLKILKTEKTTEEQRREILAKEKQEATANGNLGGCFRYTNKPDDIKNGFLNLIGIMSL